MTNKNRAAQELAKLKHKKNPNSVEHMTEISKKGVEARKKKKLELSDLFNTEI